MNPTHITPVAIAGAGPCGLLTALLLARSGIECAVFERHSGLIDHPKAMALTARSASIFHSLGLLQDLHAGSLPMNGRDLAIWSRSLLGEEWGRIPLPQVTDPHFTLSGMHCPQTVTESVLLSALEKEPNASIFFDHEVDAVNVGADGIVQLSVRRPAPAVPLSVHAKYLVAADGAASPVRRWIGIPAEGPGDQGHFLNIYFRANFGKYLEKRRAVLYQILSEEGFESFVAVNGTDRWLMHHFLRPGESPSDFDSSRLQEIIRAASGIEDEAIEILGVSPWVMSPKVAKSFRQGAIFLTGDAASRLSPNGGLGMNTGLQAAHNLAWKLAATLRGAPDSLLNSYHEERHPVAMESFLTADQFRSEVFETIAAGIVGEWAHVRALIASSVRKMPPALGMHYESGAIVPDSSDPQIAGSLVPHIRVSNDEGTFSILDWLGYSWVLIAAGDASDWTNAAKSLPDFMDEPLVRQVGGKNGAGDVDGQFLASFGLSPGGSVLVRPDGFVAWHCPHKPANATEALQAALRIILSNEEPPET